MHARGAVQIPHISHSAIGNLCIISVCPAPLLSRRRYPIFKGPLARHQLIFQVDGPFANAGVFYVQNVRPADGAAWVLSELNRRIERFTYQPESVRDLPNSAWSAPPYFANADEQANLNDVLASSLSGKMTYSAGVEFYEVRACNGPELLALGGHALHQHGSATTQTANFRRARALDELNDVVAFAVQCSIVGPLQGSVCAAAVLQELGRWLHRPSGFARMCVSTRGRSPLQGLLVAQSDADKRCEPRTIEAAVRAAIEGGAIHCPSLPEE